MTQGSGYRRAPCQWLQYADHEMAPLRRSRRGSITPVTNWILYAGHKLDPICRSRNGSYMAVGDRAIGCADSGPALRKLQCFVIKWWDMMSQAVGSSPPVLTAIKWKIGDEVWVCRFPTLYGTGAMIESGSCPNSNLALRLCLRRW